MPQRPPPKPPASSVPAARTPAARVDDPDSTVLMQQPNFSDDGDASGIVFEDIGRTNASNPVNTSDISLIEGVADPSMESPRLTSFGDGVMLEETDHPSTEVMSKLAFSEVESGPVDVRKWKTGKPQALAGDDTSDMPPASSSHRPLPAPAPDERHARASLFHLPSTDDPAPSAPGDTPGAPAGGGLGGTRVDMVAPTTRPLALDVGELKKTLEEAEKLLKTVKTQLSGMDLESRGTNAQLAAALHRLSEALAMLKR